MTEQRVAHGDGRLQPLQGLQLLEGADVGMCTDGVCSVPTAKPTDSVPQKSD